VWNGHLREWTCSENWWICRAQIIVYRIEFADTSVNRIATAKQSYPHDAYARKLSDCSMIPREMRDRFQRDYSSKFLCDIQRGPFSAT
jgi:hypothetical protein